MIDDSQHMLLRAQIDFWREMIQFNRRRVDAAALADMHDQLARATRRLHRSPQGALALAA